MATTISAVPLWVVEARTGESFWEIAAVAGDKAMAQALQAELEHDGYAARVCEREGLAPHEAEAVHRQIENRSEDQRARWEPYYYRAAARLQGMDEASFLAKMRSRTAEAAIGTSALPSVGAVGVIAAARRALLEVDLARLSASSTVEAFARELDAATEAVRGMLPPPADRWGNARKAANLYLRDVLYNSYLAPAHGFDRIKHWLELPLEEETVIELRHRTSMPLPRWPGMHRMAPDAHLAWRPVTGRLRMLMRNQYPGTVGGSRPCYCTRSAGPAPSRRATKSRGAVAVERPLCE